MRESIIYLLIFMLCLGFLVSGTVTHAAETVDFSLTAPSVVKQGEIFQIVLNGTNLSNVYGYEVKISFDESILALESAKMQKDGFSVGPIFKSNETVCAFTKVGNVAEMSGNLALCIYTFTAKNTGKAAITLSTVKLVDKDVKSSEYKVNKKIEIIVERKGTPDHGGGEGDTKPEPETDPTPVKKTFKDLAGYSWAKEAIEELASKGIINGTSQTTFEPGKNITRADFLILLVKALNLEAEIDSSFDDVKPADYYYEAVTIAKKLGITKGVGENKFNPKAEISRQDMMVMVARALEVAKKTLPAGTTEDIRKFSDAKDVSGYAVEAVAALVKKGIIVGSNNRINPKGTATRAETAIVIYKIYGMK